MDLRSWRYVMSDENLMKLFASCLVLMQLLGVIVVCRWAYLTYYTPEQITADCIEVQTDRWDDTHELVRTSELRRQIDYQIARCHKG